MKDAAQDVAEDVTQDVVEDVLGAAEDGSPSVSGGRSSPHPWPTPNCPPPPRPPRFFISGFFIVVPSAL